MSKTERNPSMSAVGQEALRRLNCRYAEDGTERPSFFRRYFSKTHAGVGVTLDYDGKRQIARELAEDIEDLSSDYFGGEPIFRSLFAEPSTAPDPVSEADVEDALADAAAAYAAKSEPRVGAEKTTGQVKSLIAVIRRGPTDRRATGFRDAWSLGLPANKGPDSRYT